MGVPDLDLVIAFYGGNYSDRVLFVPQTFTFRNHPASRAVKLRSSQRPDGGVRGAGNRSLRGSAPACPRPSGSRCFVAIPARPLEDARCGPTRQSGPQPLSFFRRRLCRGTRYIPAASLFGQSGQDRQLPVLVTMLGAGLHCDAHATLIFGRISSAF